MRQSTVSVLGALLAILSIAPGVAAAHGDGDGHLAWVPPALFLVGVGVLGASVYADHVDRASRRATDLGVAVGALGVLVGVALVAI